MVLMLWAGGCGRERVSLPPARPPTLPGVQFDDRHGDPELKRKLLAAFVDVDGWLRQNTVAPNPQATPTGMRIVLFPNRTAMAQWAAAEGINAFTMVDRGGVSGDFGAAFYYVGDNDTLRLARHEYVHQYLLLHAERRLPPFVEEGVATMLDGGGDTARLELLAELDTVTPIGELVTTHAGMLRDASMAERSAWYAQAWAFAEFVDERAPMFWQEYFASDVGFATLLAEALHTDWPGVESAYAAFVEELVR
ncbi:MAG: hypothetical protein AAF743_00120 [Planctomycetota bacterium]